MVSTRGRYALRLMIDLAEHSDSGLVPLKDIAERQAVSLKYLEKILPVLVKNNCVEGIHGKGGGYKLTRNIKDYTVGEILRLTEGDLAPVPCLGFNAEVCSRKSDCRTYSMWNGLNHLINDYFDKISIADLVKTNQ